MGSLRRARMKSRPGRSSSEGSSIGRPTNICSRWQARARAEAFKRPCRVALARRRGGGGSQACPAGTRPPELPGRQAVAVGGGGPRGGGGGDGPLLHGGRLRSRRGERSGVGLEGSGGQGARLGLHTGPPP